MYYYVYGQFLCFVVYHPNPGHDVPFTYLAFLSRRIFGTYIVSTMHVALRQGKVERGGRSPLRGNSRRRGGT